MIKFSDEVVNAVLEEKVINNANMIMKNGKTVDVRLIIKNEAINKIFNKSLAETNANYLIRETYKKDFAYKLWLTSMKYAENKTEEVLNEILTDLQNNEITSGRTKEFIKYIYTSFKNEIKNLYAYEEKLCKQVYIDSYELEDDNYNRSNVFSYLHEEARTYDTYIGLEEDDLYIDKQVESYYEDFLINKEKILTVSQLDFLEKYSEDKKYDQPHQTQRLKSIRKRIIKHYGLE